MGKNNILILLSVCLAYFSFANAQNVSDCVRNGTILFWEDFGGNLPTDPPQKPTGIPQCSYTYNAYDPRDNYGNGVYSIRKACFPSHVVWYSHIDDYTYPNDSTRGYLMQVDASSKPGSFYYAKIDNICAGTSLFFSIWGMSATKSDNPIYQNGNLSLIIETTTGTQLARKDIELVNGKGYWEQFGLNFTVPSGTTSVVYRIINNGTAVKGNDFMLDDIQIILCAPTITIENSLTEYCVGDNVQIKGSFINDGTFTEPIEFQWLKSSTGDLGDKSSWVAVSGNNNETLRINSFDVNDVGFYSLAVASAGNINSVNCRAMSQPIHLTLLDNCFNFVLGEIPEICADADFFYIPFSVNGLITDSYSVHFGEKEHSAHFLDKDNIISQNNEIKIDLPANVRPDNYSAKIIFSGGGLTKEIPLDFTVLYSWSIITQRWNDVLALINEKYNGGYFFSAYEWYKNGVQIPNENGSYLYVGANGDELDFTAEYRAKITRKDDGVTLFTCPYYPEYNKDAYLTLHPTIAATGQPIIIKTEKSGRATIWNILGFQIAEYQLISGTNSINAPSVTGTYFLKIENNSSKQQTLKIIVK